MELRDRCKLVRETANLNMRLFGERLGISSAAVSQIESGKTGISDQTIRSLCREFGISEVWLRTGVGEMRREEHRAEELGRSIRELLADQSDSFRTRLLTTLLRFDPDGPEWEILERIVDEVAGKEESPEP